MSTDPNSLRASNYRISSYFILSPINHWLLSVQISINAVFATTAQISSLIKMLSYKLDKYNITPIRIGMGINYGRALMIKAGYSGSSINMELIEAIRKIRAKHGTVTHKITHRIWG